MFKMKFVVTAAIFTLFTMASVAWGQSSKGIVVGNVTDQTGAVVSGATVKVTNSATNVSRETVSTAEGNFRLDAVDPGTYKLEINAEGFKTSAVDGVIVAAGQITSNNLKLEVGTKSEVVEIVSNSVILQADDGARTATLDSRQIVDLPINSLNPVSLALTLPGVVKPGRTPGVQGVEMSVNGLRPRANNQLIDGTENNDVVIQGQAYLPSLRDGYQEVSVLSGNNAAEYGKGGGAVINLVTKSGTNNFHGSVYDIIEPSAFYSLSSGQKANEGLKSVPVSIQNQPGFSLGGPIIKDKLFFFGTYQKTMQRAGAATSSAVVPTANGLALLRTLFPAGKSPNLDVYLNTIGDLRGTTNIRAVPLGDGRPDISFGVATKTGLVQPLDDDQFLTRVDWAATSKDSLTFRYLYDKQNSQNQVLTAFNGFEIDVPSSSHNFYFNYTHTFSPSLINEFRSAYGRFDVPFKVRNPELANIPRIGIAGGITSIGLESTYPQQRLLNNFQFQDTITYTVGNHTIRAGADLVRQKTKQTTLVDVRGTFAFTPSAGFSAFANFVDGFSGTSGTFSNRAFGERIIYPNRFQQSYFISDSWRIKSNLTLNYGVRYENYGTPVNVLKFPAIEGLSTPLGTRIEQKRDDNNFAPRVSFAYTPRYAKWLFGEEKTVLRGGYSISYDVFFDNITNNVASSSPNLIQGSLFGSTGGTPRGIPNATTSTFASTGKLNPFGFVSSIDPNLRSPLTHVWNLGVQRQIFNNVIVDVAYVGSRGTRLYGTENLNPRIDPTRGLVTSRTNSGDSIYHALQTRVERGFKHGVFARFAYTYSKAIDNISEVFATTGIASRPSNPFNRAVDRGPASFDVPHRASWTWVWDIPGPKSGILGQIAGGWNVSGTYELQTGAVETPFVNGIDLNGDGEPANDRPAISNPNAPANSVAILASIFVDPAATGYVDAEGNPINPANARYIVDPAIRTRIAGRNTLRALRTNTMDLSINKAFKLPFEGHKIELRFDCFNVLNHPNFTWTNGDVSNGDVLSSTFNNVRLNDGGNLTNGNRTGRIQVRYSF